MFGVRNNNQCTDFTLEISPIKEDAMTRYQFLNIKTFHLIIADAKEVAWQLGLDEGAVVGATRDVNFGSPSRSSPKTESTRFCHF
jgi:hypothetical protein